MCYRRPLWFQNNMHFCKNVIDLLEIMYWNRPPKPETEMAYYWIVSQLCQASSVLVHMHYGSGKLAQNIIKKKWMTTHSFVEQSDRKHCPFRNCVACWFCQHVCSLLSRLIETFYFSVLGNKLRKDVDALLPKGKKKYTVILIWLVLSIQVSV